MNNDGGGDTRLLIVDAEHANAVKRLYLSTMSGAKTFGLKGRAWKFDTHNWKTIQQQVGSAVPIVPVPGEPALKLTSKEQARILRGQWK